MISQYIKGVIDNHQKEFSIIFTDENRHFIESNINIGIYAFQIIYIYLLTNTSGKVDWKVIEIKPLDWSKLRYNSDAKTIRSLGLWSYDGGVRYQWSETETLVFDPSVIRDIKLEEIIK